ncbi:uncharacterized protein LOC141905900 isoform X6 [Tubulanus polymorphus]|uniref:uncharacterized protein LOC141905900 isoform X6 n=1 Tax=Tubulanus polymorphus TaxID=672921 RepID=UPI003DA4FE52
MPFRQYVVKPNSAADARFTTTPTFDSAYFTVENNSTQMDGGMYQDTGGGGLPMSYHHQRAASLESLESSATSQTRYSSDSGGDGTSYSREGSHPRDGISRGGSAGNYHGLRRASLSTTAPAHSPMQFVKTDISPLAIKAAMHVQKMKKFEEEKKKAKEIEPWQGDTYLQDLSNWRDKRRKQSVTNPTESSDHDQTDASDQEQPKEQPKTKTFSEIMKERKSRRHSYNFYPIDDSASTIVDVDIESNAQDKPAVITNSNDDRDRNQRTIRKKDETDCGVTKETDPEIIELLKRVAAMKAQQLRNKGSESESESEDSETGEVQKQNEKNEKVATITKTDSLTPPRRTSVGSTGRRRSSSEAPYIINPNRNLPGLQRQFSGKYEDKEIQLKQNPHKSDGFGFTIKGGIDQLLPILVDNIIEGSTADDADICEGDELLYVNGQTCENQFKGSVMLVINSAVKAGQLNIKLRRFENARKKSSTTVPPILPPTQAQIETLYETAGPRRKNKPDSTLKTPLQRARRSLSLDSGRSTPPAPIMETLPDINEAPSPSPAGKTKPKLQAFSFLEKFAAEEEKEGRANEKPKMRQSSALPFLDKYLKSQDKFEQLANLEDDATDDKQKTFTFLDTLQNSTPPPDLSATTKPKPYKSDSPTVNGDTAVVKPDTTKPEAPATVGKLDEQALWARVESQMSAAPMGRKKRLSQHEDLNTSSASSTGSVDKKLEKQWKSVENNNAQSENNAETTKKSLFQPKYKPVEFKKAVKSPEPTSAKPPIAKQKQSDNNNVIKKAAVAKDAAKPNIKQSPTTKQNGSSPSKRINGGALSPSTVQSGPKRNGKPSVLNRWDPASLQEEKRKREQWIKDQEKRHKELLEKEQALHKSEEEEQEEADRSHRQIKDVEDSKLLLLKTGAAPDVVIRSTEQHKIESTYNRKQDDEDAQLEYPRDEDEKKRQLDYERRRRIDEQKRKLEIDIAETKQKMADDRRSRDRKNRQLSEDQQRQVWIEEQEIEQEERELELLRREEERKLKEWEERMKRDAEQRKNEPRRDIHYQDRRTAQEPRNNDGRGGYYQDHGNGRTQPESVILRTSRNGPSYSMPTKTRPDSVPNHAQVSRQPVPNHPQHRRPESLPVHYQLVRESNSPNLSGKNNYHDTKKPLVSPKGIMKQSSSPPRSPLVSRRMDSPGKELVDGVLNSPQFAKRGHTSPNMRSKSAERLNSKPFIENSLQKQQQQQQQYRPGFNNSRSMHNLRVDSPSSQTRYDNSKTPHGEAMHREIQNPQQHWLFEEAERRRIDEQRYKEQQLKYAQQQQQPTHRNESRNHPRNARNDSRRYDERLSPNKDPSLRNHSPNKDLGYRPAHMEQSTKPVNTVKEYDMPPKKPVHYSGPIPDAIKQTLLQRVSSPKSPNPPDYADYSQYPQYSAGYSPKPQHNPSYSQPGQYNPSYNTHPGPKSYQNVPHSVDGLVRMSSPHVANRSSPYSGNSAADLRGSAKGPPKPPRNVPGGAEVEQVLAVSGQHRCCHCNQELGHGAAMVIESLQLYYHMQCFRCVVCHTPLSYGHNGADVRVRASRLHCVNCYSNDEGIEFMGTF